MNVTRRARALAAKLRARRYTEALAMRAAAEMVPHHPSAYARFGERSVIGVPCRVTHPECIEIGDGVVINEHAWLSVVPVVDGITPRLVIGDGTLIDRLVHIACVGEVVIGRDVLFAERVFVADTYHGYEEVGTPILHQPTAHPRPVSIGDGAHVGIGACILAGVTIGEGALVGAGAVVTDDVPAHSVVVGNPARVVRRYSPTTGTWDPV